MWVQNIGTTSSCLAILQYSHENNLMGEVFKHTFGANASYSYRSPLLTTLNNFIFNYHIGRDRWSFGILESSTYFQAI